MEKNLLNVKELSEYTGISKSTIYEWVSMKKIPYIKIGKLVKFDPKDIGAFIQNHKIKPGNLAL